MASIILERTSESVNRFRDFGVYFDDKKIGTVYNGETKKFELPPGNHTIYLKIDWASSETIAFNLTDHETKTFRVGGFKYSKWITRLALPIIFLDFILRVYFDIRFVTFLLFPVFIFLIYYLSFGRKKYLTLVQKSSGNDTSIANE